MLSSEPPPRTPRRPGTQVNGSSPDALKKVGNGDVLLGFRRRGARFSARSVAPIQSADEKNALEKPMRIRFIGRFLPALILAALPVVASAGVFVGVSVDVPPPPLPVYVQPPCPQPGYIWEPGYWAWGPYGYYWVPGTWVLPPQVGLLWTPGYWGWDGAAYLWHAGYWGPTVGFYGGIDYGFGYDGIGFDGGFWRSGLFFYNRAVVRLGFGFGNDDYYRRPHPRPYFDRGRFRHISFNGGRDGVRAHPDRRDRIAARERRFGLTGEQRRHEFMARGDRALRANFNHGRPPIAATDRPVRFHGRGVIAARAAGGPFFRHGARRMPTDRPAWAASPRDSGPRAALRRHWNGPAPRFTSRRGPIAYQRAHHAAPHAWTTHRYGRQPAYQASSRFRARPAPRYAYHPARRSHFRPAPRAQYRPAYHPVPHFQARRPMPHFQAHRPVPHFQARRPMPHFQAHRPAPRFQARHRPHGPRRH